MVVERIDVQYSKFLSIWVVLVHCMALGELVYEYINALKKKTYNLKIQFNCSLITLFVCLE